MAKKTYGPASISKLRNEGCPNREIEDIIYVADKHRAKPSKVEGLLASGYNVNQISEIYDAARTSMTSIDTMDAFCEVFKPDKDCLASMANEVYGLTEAGTCGDSRSGKIYIAGFFKKIIDLQNEYDTDFCKCFEMLEDSLSKDEAGERILYEFDDDTGEVLI